MIERARAKQNYAAQGGGTEDEELREAKAFGFGFAPLAESGVEGALIGGEGVGRIGAGELCME